MTFASICTGVGGMDQGLERAGHTLLWMCEIDRACREVLRYHYPTTPIYEDMTKLDVPNLVRPDILALGTPCQGFSVAGLRGSLGDDRSNLCLVAVRIINELNPRIVIFENVPGILSTPDNAFGCFLAAVVGCDAPLVPPDAIRRWREGKSGRYFSWTDAGLVVGPTRAAAWRILDSKFFGVAQRRERVFVVVDSGDGSCQQILFNEKSVCRNPEKGQEPGKGVAGTLGSRTTGGGGLGTDFDLAGGLQVANRVTGGACPETAMCLNARQQRIDMESETFVTHPLKASHDGSEDGTGRGVPLVAATLRSGSSNPASHNNPSGLDENLVAFHGGSFPSSANDQSLPLGTRSLPTAIAYRTSGNCGPFEQGDKTAALNTATDPTQNIIACVAIRTAQTSSNGCGIDESGASYTPDGARGQAVKSQYGVRRLTPTECERLQNWPDGWTLNAVSEKDGKVYQQSDSARYKQCGNGVTASVAEWIGHRIFLHQKSMESLLK